MLKIYQEIIQIHKEQKQAITIQVVEKTGHGPAKPGIKMLITSDGQNFGTIGGGKIEHLAMQKAKEIMHNDKCLLQKYWLSEDESIVADNQDFEKTGMMCGGTITLFFEPIGTAKKLYIIGAGHIGKSLLYYLTKLDFNITICDIRPEYINSITYENLNKQLIEDYSHIFENDEIPPGAFFIVATHSHDFDYLVLKQLFKLQLKPKYIGALASSKKALTLINQLKTEVPEFLDTNVLHMPIGLNIGGATPDEIALSITAQIQQVKNGKTDLNF